MAAKRKPGLSIPDAERHTLKRTLRLKPAESAALDAVAEARGVNVSRAVGGVGARGSAAAFVGRGARHGRHDRGTRGEHQARRLAAADKIDCTRQACMMGATG